MYLVERRLDARALPGLLVSEYKRKLHLPLVVRELQLRQRPLVRLEPVVQIVSHAFVLLFLNVRNCNICDVRKYMLVGDPVHVRPLDAVQQRQEAHF